MRFFRKINEFVTRQGYGGCKPCALGSDRVFGNLHDHGVAVVQHVFNGFKASVILARGKNVMHMQKCRPFQSDIDKGGLHAGQHAHDFAFIDIADEASLGATLNVQVFQNAVDHDGHARFLSRAVNQKLFIHFLNLSAKKSIQKFKRGGGAKPNETLSRNFLINGSNISFS